MKTKFFKKLSFVLAVAMVLSVLYPAAGVFAASAPKLNRTEKTLHLDVEGKNEYDFNISNKQKGWKYAWESSDENVVTVNEKGVVTATGAGKATVTVTITDKDGEVVDTLPATVTVRDNIKEVKISNPPEGNKLAVGQEYDFNRSYVTVSGRTKGSESITRWTVEPTEGATIVANSGLFTATAAGKYTVTARAFQSKAKYSAWLEDSETYKDYVLDEDSIEITVAPSMVEAKQKDLDTIEVTFDSAMAKEDLQKNLKVAYVAGATKVNHQIKDIKVEDKVATVDLYGDLIKAVTYVVEYPDMESVKFESSAVKATEVVSGEVLTKTAQVSVEEEIQFALYDVNGVDVTAAFKDRVDIESSNTASYLNKGDKKLTMFKVGDTTTIKMTYHTYEYDLTTNTEKGAFSFEGIVTCIEKKADNVGTISAYTVTNKTADFDNAKHTVAAGDSGYTLYVQLKGTKADGSELITKSTGTAGEKFKFTSSDEKTMIINPETGSIYPIKEGTVSVVVYYDNVYVGTAVINIVASRRVNAVNLSTQSLTLSNHADVNDIGTVTVEVKDQLQDDYSNISVTPKLVGTTSVADFSNKTKKTEIKFNAFGVAAGSYTYAIEVKDTANNFTVVRYVYVTIQEPKGDSAYYEVKAASTEYDLKVKSGDTTETATLTIFGMANNGVKREKVNVVSKGYTVEVKDPNGNVYTVGKGLTVDGFDVKLELIDVDTTTVSGKALLVKKATGTYVVTAKNASGKAISTTYFTVKDSQDAASLTFKSFLTDKATVLDAINDCIEVKVAGTKYTVESLADVVYTQTGNYVYIDKVTVYVPVDGYALKYTVDVKQPIRMN